MVNPTIEHDVKDLSLAEEGVNRIEWAAREMPVIRTIGERFARERPLAGLRVAACLHVVAQEEYPWCDLRVDDHPDPVAELRRVLELYKREQPFWQMMLPRRDDYIPQWDAVMRVRDSMENSLEEEEAEDAAVKEY